MSCRAIGIGRLMILGSFVGTWLLAGGFSGAWAGPARYDPETKSFQFTYTFAALTDGLFGDAAIGAPQKPTTEQDARVRTVVLKVSDALSKATAGRAKILSLDFVPDVKRADIVISLTGKPARGGWAIAGAIEGRPGQIGLYYQTLAEELEQDYVLTAAHEISHYLFGLVDEYNFPSGCPVANPGGPGCLMDNYLSNGSRHGWYGRYCRDDHAADPSQKRSCQDIVDEFFRARNIVAPTEDTPGTPTVSAGSASAITTNRQAVIDNLTRATIGKVREEAEARNKGRKGGALASVTSLREFARKFLDEQLKVNQVALPREEVGNLIDGALKQAASLIKVAIPPRLEPVVKLIARFADERAKDLRDKSPKDSDSARRQKILKGLLAFVAGLGSNAPTVDGPLTAEERRYLEHVAMQAAAKADEAKVTDELYNAILANMRLGRETASNVLDIAGEVGVVGIENRLAALGEVDADLRKYLPGKTASSGFGRRRTIVIDPDPLAPQFDYMVTQSGIYRYDNVRASYLELFQRLVERAQLEVLTTEMQRRRQQKEREEAGKPMLQRLREERLSRIAQLADPNTARAQREADLRAVVNELIGEVKRNRLENIVFLVPPGGIPQDMSPLFEMLRRQLIIKVDVRLDLVLVGPTTVPFELRDIAVGTGGSIVTLPDFDEVGAVAQRLKNDQAFGCWVVLPQQNEIRGHYYRTPQEGAAKPAPWLLDDPKRERFADPQPIVKPFNAVLERLHWAADYFGTDAARDLKRAGVLTLNAQKELLASIDEILLGYRGANEAVDQREAAKGLIDEICTIRGAVVQFNNRTLGAEDRVRSELVERLIRARNLYEELKQFLLAAEAAHEPFLSPDYNEEDLFRKGYEKTKDDVKKLGDSVSGLLGPPEIRIAGGPPMAMYLVDRRAGDFLLGMNEAAPRAPARAGPAPQRVPIAPGEDAPAAVPPGADDVQSTPPAEKEKRAVIYEKETPPNIIQTDNLVRLLQDRMESIVAHGQLEAKKATYAYLRLKRREVELRLVHDFLDQIEKELAGFDRTALFRRIDRQGLVRATQQIQDKAPSYLAAVPGALSRPPLPPIDTTLTPDRAIRLPRFYAENQRFDPTKKQSEFELILGLSQPLPGVDAAAIRENDRSKLPELRLYNDNGLPVETPSLQLDRDASTTTCLIYRFSPEFGETGWYTAALLLKDRTLRFLSGDKIHYTFSVASTRPNFRLTAAQVQVANDPELIPPPPRRGLARAMDRRVKVEVQVYGGTSVLGASLRGVMYKLDQGTEPIVPLAQDFHDDGKTYGDRQKDDGVYTTLIPLDQVETDKEYRLLIQADSTPDSKNIAPEDPSRRDEERRKQAIDKGKKNIRPASTEKVETPQPQEAVVFQRATSIQIRVQQ